MTRVQEKDESTIKLNMPASIHLTDELLFDLCQKNKDKRIERTAEGDLIIMPPTGGKTGNYNFKLIGLFSKITDSADSNWIGFDSSTGFILPNGALRSPDIAFVAKEKWDALSDDQQEKFIPLCPDFVIELRSASDNIDDLKDKMREYLENGAQLGWLFDPFNKKIYIYKSDNSEECLDNPINIFGDPLIPGFNLELKRFWD